MNRAPELDGGVPDDDGLALRVNGEPVVVRRDLEVSLLSVLRDELGLTGARFGCGLALCGACFVRLDGAVVPACDTPLWQAEGAEVVTVEGLSHDNRPHPVQQALIDHQAGQCGFCLAGIVVRAAALLEQDPAPDEAAVRAALEKNLCRCGAQGRMVAAVVEAGRAAS